MSFAAARSLRWHRIPAEVGLSLLLLAVTGCGARGFRVDGELASEGGGLGTWKWRPQGCIRAEARDAGGVGVGAVGVASLLWINPVRRDGSRANGNQFKVSDAPIRLDLARVGGEPVAVLDTVRTQGTEFRGENCRTMALETHEEKPTLRGGRAALAGTLRMDCQVRGSHVTAEARFTGCDY